MKKLEFENQLTYQVEVLDETDFECAPKFYDTIDKTDIEVFEKWLKENYPNNTFATIWTNYTYFPTNSNNKKIVMKTITLNK